MKRTAPNDLRYIKTERLIQQTFRDMILEMDYPQISIKELTERAMINRKTFYLHYNTLDELLGVLQIELYNDFFQTTSEIKFPDDLEKFVHQLFTFCADMSMANEKILYSQGHFPEGKNPIDYVKEKIFNSYLLVKNPSGYSRTENNIVISYLIGSIFCVYTQWIADGKKIPLENIVKYTTQLVSQGLNSLLD
ncbi:MAG: hypothetical protein NC398_06395 [Acetatifactor muris]|nr:hypothetical protein [Acetatifactor muris]MCM1526622.1 hypothetical protein [Bacteroides sp.]